VEVPVRRVPPDRELEAAPREPVLVDPDHLAEPLERHDEVAADLLHAGIVEAAGGEDLAHALRHRFAELVERGAASVVLGNASSSVSSAPWRPRIA